MPSSASSSGSSSDDEAIKRKRPSAASAANVTESDSDSDEESLKENTTDEAPVLSHAEQRKRKKKEKKTANGGQESPNKKRKLNDGKAASSDTKRQNSVWVGNLSFKTTADDLRTFFDGCGTITRVNLPTKPTRKGAKPENRGFAYVDFDTAEAKLLAIERSERPLTGRKLLIKDGSDFAGRPAATVTAPGDAEALHTKTAQKILKIQKQPPAPTLFFGNLGFNTTEDSLRGLLEAHKSGKKDKSADKKSDGAQTEVAEDEKWIRKIRMGTFEDTGKCKGFAFVDFSTIEHATSALINPRNHRLDGRDLVVEYASPDAVRRGASKQTPQTGDKTSAPHLHKKPRPDPSKRSIKREDNPHTQNEVLEEVDDAVVHKIAASKPANRDRKEKPGRSEARGGSVRSRPKPGAALALAKRESAAILPSQGKKVTFD